jgi:enediyne biosynthesis protein E4
MQSKPIRVTMKNKNYILASTIILAVLARAEAQTQFTKITNGPIATDVGQFAVGAWADFGNHGLLDLFVANYNNRTNVLYTNNGDGSFTKVTVGDPVQDSAYHVCPAVADYDNDGYPDLLVSAGVDAPSAEPNKLYHNNGNGTFTLAGASGVGNVTGFFNTSSAVDYDNDGFVDFFVPGINAPGVLFRNNGDGTFSRPASAINVPEYNGSLAWADYDNDGCMDLIITYAATVGGDAVNYLYHNNRDGTFTRILTGPVATDQWSAGAWGTSWGDYDNDGLLDLFVAGTDTGNRLYHNNGNGVFTNVTSGPMLAPGPGDGSQSCAWGDYDNDGYLDLFAGSSHGQSQLFHNNGDGTFEKITSGDPVNDSNLGIHCNACGWVDYDNDGFLDLFVARMADAGVAPNLLFHNNGNSNAWLKVKLVGTLSNRSAIGAHVRVHATIGGKTFWQLREINSGGGRWIQPLVAHFGLGDATNIDTVRIEWPSGTIQQFTNVAPRQFLTITEPSWLLASLTNGAPQFTLKGGRNLSYDIQASSDLTLWSPVGAVTITNLDGTTQIIDSKTPSSGNRFYRALSH